MAGSATQRRVTTPQNSDQRDTTSAVNNLVDDVETLRAALVALTAKLDADSGVGDTDYASTLDVAAAELTAAKVQDEGGTDI